MNSDTSRIAPKKLKVEDASLSDEKIPRNLILMYGDTPYIMKAGLEWKANKLFGGAGFSIAVDLIENDREKKYVLVKATLEVLKNGAIYENYGEASLDNTNSMMVRQLLHLAITRAECRVLRMATATGYASYDEVATQPGFGAAKAPQLEDPNEPATPDQISAMYALGYDKEPDNTLTKGEAAEWIRNATKK